MRDEQETVLIQIDDEYEDSMSAARENPSDMRVFRTNQLNSIVSKLKNILMGPEGSRKFKHWVLRAIRILFTGALNDIQCKPNPSAVQQRDIVGTNAGKGILWRRIIEDFRSRQLIFEVKNYEPLKVDDYRQALSSSGGPHGSFAVMISRSENEGMSGHERAWLLEMWAQHQMLIFTVPVSVLSRCLWRIRNAMRTEYAEEAFAEAVRQI